MQSHVGPTRPFVRFEPEAIEQSIPERFEQQVRKYPGRIALKTAGEELTYEELNVAANRVANTLLARRGERAETVALLLSDDVPIVAAMLGSLKAGKIYVPLAPSLPRARNADMLADSGAEIVLTDEDTGDLGLKLAGSDQHLLNVDRIDAGTPAVNPCLSISPDALAYILYTSGSTGKPKGVVENHRNLLHFIMNITNGFHFSSEDRMVVSGSYCTSGPLFPIYGALLNGAALHPVDTRAVGAGMLARWLREERITALVSGPLTSVLLSQLDGSEEFPDLRLLHSGAIPLYRRTVDLYRKHFTRQCVLVNGLSMTEKKGICHYVVDWDSGITEAVAPVGYAYDGVEILVLDAAGEPVPPQQVGEVAIKSRYLPPGYWGNPDLTRSVFLPSPDGGDERIFRTGDLGRKSLDGCLTLLGRKDFQLKVRGYRVEVAEVELALLQLDGIREVVVVGRKDRLDEMRLVAYLVVDEQTVPTVEWLQTSLGERLPEYMIPSTFVVLDALPRNPSDKIDRQALPPPDPKRPLLSQPFVAPRTPIEQTVAKIWAELLGVDRVGAHDGFLALGGDSLRATRIASRVRDTLRVQVPLRVLLESTTVAQMAAAIVESHAMDIRDGDLTDLLHALESEMDHEPASPAQVQTP